MGSEYAHEFTIVVIGSGAVGKTSITVMLTTGTFEEDYDPTIEATYEKELKVGNEKVLLTIVDTAGQEEYSVLQDNYWRDGDGFLMVFDVTSKQSFRCLPDYWEKITKAKETEQLPVVLCANKVDLPQEDYQVTSPEINTICEENSWISFNTSALKNSNINEAFVELVKRMIKYKRSFADGDSDSESSPSKKKKKGGLLKKLFGKKK